MVANGHNDVRSSGNTKHEAPIPNLPYPERFDLDAAVRGMMEDGYCIFPGVLDAEGVQKFRAKIDSLGGPDEQYEVANWCFNKQLKSDYENDPEMLEYIDKEDIYQVCREIFNDRFHVIGGSLWVTGQGRGMGIHVDFLPFPLPEDVSHDPRVTIPIFMATAHYYLDDLTLDMGPTTVIPGSHRAGRPPKDETSYRGVEPHAVMLKAGDVCLFRSDLWHGAAKNTSTKRRYMVQVHYGYGPMAKWYPDVKYRSLWSDAVIEAASERQLKLFSTPGIP
jgi:hypothetical protein